MRRGRAWEWLALALLASAWAGTRLQAQEKAAAVETIQIRPNVYVIFGGGANVTAHVGDDGVVLVDPEPYQRHPLGEWAAARARADAQLATIAATMERLRGSYGAA